MRKHIIKFGLIFVTFAAVFIACEREFIEETVDHSTAMSTEEAQVWFEANQPEFLVLKSGDKEKKTKVVKPKWDGAFTSNNEKVEVVETHIISNGGFGFTTKDSYDEWKATGHRGYMTSLTRLVILKYKKSGETVSFLMTIIGDKNYLEQKEFKMWGNTYLTKDKDFNGLVLFHSLEGAFVNGWRFTDGKVSHTVDVNFNEQLPIQLKSGFYDCSAYPVYGWFQDCTDYWTVGEVDGQITSVSYDGTVCDAPYMDYAGSSVECTYVDDDDDGSGTYDPPNPNNIPCPGDPVLNPTIAPTQNGNVYGGMYGCTRTGGSDCTEGIYNREHDGIDIYAEECTDLYSMHEGKIYDADWSSTYGLYVIVQSTINGCTVLIQYAHLSEIAVLDTENVSVGTILGKTGTSGLAGNDPATTPHVHVRAIDNWTNSVDPISYLSTTFNNDGSVNSPCNQN